MSELGTHTGSGNRFNMYLSAPNGGVAQMLAHPEGEWVSARDYVVAQDEIARMASYARELELKLRIKDAEVEGLMAKLVELDDLKARVDFLEGRDSQ